MRRKWLALLIVAVCLSSPGCAAVYTSISKANDGSYTVTKVRQGFFRVYGELYRCTANGESMTCTKLGGV